jgi:hypothetical protein
VDGVDVGSGDYGARDLDGGFPPARDEAWEAGRYETRPDEAVLYRLSQTCNDQLFEFRDVCVAELVLVVGDARGCAYLGASHASRGDLLLSSSTENQVTRTDEPPSSHLRHSAKTLTSRATA